MIDKKSRFSFWLVFIVAAITLLPFCGSTDFTTKGEPREAVVAVSMLQQHNWILPTNNGVDIPYKPPFFQWCIATLSLPTGEVTPFTSRLPSAIALILMASFMAAFIAKRKNSAVAIVAAGLMLTAFEVHRAGTNCRVDMVLTLFIVGALYLLYRWWESGCRQLPWLAILAMSGATLTKGPVGIVLPCFVMGVFLIVMAWRDHTRPATVCLHLFGQLLPAALLACVLPGLWYAAAYQQGGDDFLWLVKDENFGRFLGKMLVVTHANPWPYNILMLIVGWLPWTLPLLLSLSSSASSFSSLSRALPVRRKLCSPLSKPCGSLWRSSPPFPLSSQLPLLCAGLPADSSPMSPTPKRSSLPSLPLSGSKNLPESLWSLL